MRYAIYAKDDKCYYIKHYSSIYDIGINRRISKRDYWKWNIGKINDTDTSKIKYITTVDTSLATIKLSQEQQAIMDIVAEIVQDKGYILEKDISIDRCSKAIVGRIVKNKDILEQYKLKRVRANKRVKEDLRITDIKGYPFLIVKQG